MGNNCSPRNLDSYASTFFDVYNVDERLFKHSKGRIQITNNSLILCHQNAQTEPLQWPLNGVRRYGFHKDIFLFECGRKCKSGEGLFAFKCKKAKRLNDALHKAIINNASKLYNLQKENANCAPCARPIIDSITTTDILINNSTYASDSTNESPPNNELNFDYSMSSARNYPIVSNDWMKSTLVGQQKPPPPCHSSNTSPYYVNDGIVRLPVNLSFIKRTNSTEYNNYVNNEQVDPCILHIINGNSIQNENLEAKKKSAGKSVPIESHSLNYVLAEQLIRLNNDHSLLNKSKIAQSEKLVQVSANQEHIEKGGVSCQTEYMVIDVNKTPAIHKSKKLNEKKRLEYSFVPK